MRRLESLEPKPSKSECGKRCDTENINPKTETVVLAGQGQRVLSTSHQWDIQVSGILFGATMVPIIE